MPSLDAIIVAGGRSSRLGGSSKALLEYKGVSLLTRTVTAVQDAGANHTVVVGPDDVLRPRLPGIVLMTREVPPFSGPAAAIGAGLRSLLEARGHLLDSALDSDDITLLLACDMPQAPSIVHTLLNAVELRPGFHAWVPQDPSGRAQYLACAVRTAALTDAVGAAGDLAGKPVRVLLASLQRYTFTSDSTADVDTPADAAMFGITVQNGTRH
ncbi:NTP transferase domain-containing protein [Arthrobacter roseus]|uniref:NTP transferase domain-containing protein n=1 Tax=Arthrobacter roseus TaxID=136274 RepID=UPI00196571F2|nr:molybdopterin-guanine dinucleotide biosynthesis protein A [Arthrobacter roseus]